MSITGQLIMQSARHAMLLDAFSARQSGNITGDPINERAEQLSLMLEIVDILGELKILMLLFRKQADVINDVQRKCLSGKSQEPQQTFDGFIPMELTYTRRGETAEDLMEKAVNRLRDKEEETERLHSEVTQTHKLVSYPRPESAMVIRVAYYVANRSWSCWT